MNEEKILKDFQLNFSTSFKFDNKNLNKTITKIGDITNKLSEFDKKFKSTASSIINTFKSKGDSILSWIPGTGTLGVGSIVGIFSVYALIDKATEIRNQLLSIREGLLGISDEFGSVGYAMKNVFNAKYVSSSEVIAVMNELGTFSAHAKMSAQEFGNLSKKIADIGYISGITTQTLSTFVDSLFLMKGTMNKTEAIKKFSNALLATKLSGAEMTTVGNTINTLIQKYIGLSKDGQKSSFSFAKSIAAVAGVFSKLGLNAEKSMAFIQDVLDPENFEQNLFLFSKLGIGINEVFEAMSTAEGKEQLIDKLMMNLPKIANELANITNPRVRMQLAKQLNLPLEVVQAMQGKNAEEIKRILDEYKNRVKREEALRKKEEKARASMQKLQEQFFLLQVRVFKPVLEFIDQNWDYFMNWLKVLADFFSIIIDGIIKPFAEFINLYKKDLEELKQGKKSLIDIIFSEKTLNGISDFLAKAFSNSLKALGSNLLPSFGKKEDEGFFGKTFGFFSGGGKGDFQEEELPKKDKEGGSILSFLIKILLFLGLILAALTFFKKVVISPIAAISNFREKLKEMKAAGISKKEYFLGNILGLRKYQKSMEEKFFNKKMDNFFQDNKKELSYLEQMNFILKEISEKHTQIIKLLSYDKRFLRKRGQKGKIFSSGGPFYDFEDFSSSSYKRKEKSQKERQSYPFMPELEIGPSASQEKIATQTTIAKEKKFFEKIKGFFSFLTSGFSRFFTFMFNKFSGLFSLFSNQVIKIFSFLGNIGTSIFSSVLSGVLNLFSFTGKIFQKFFSLGKFIFSGGLFGGGIGKEEGKGGILSSLFKGGQKGLGKIGKFGKNAFKFLGRLFTGRFQGLFMGLGALASLGLFDSGLFANTGNFGLGEDFDSMGFSQDIEELKALAKDSSEAQEIEKNKQKLMELEKNKEKNKNIASIVGAALTTGVLALIPGIGLGLATTIGPTVGSYLGETVYSFFDKSKSVGEEALAKAQMIHEQLYNLSVEQINQIAQNDLYLKNFLLTLKEKEFSENLKKELAHLKAKEAIGQKLTEAEKGRLDALMQLYIKNLEDTKQLANTASLITDRMIEEKIQQLEKSQEFEKLAKARGKELTLEEKIAHARQLLSAEQMLKKDDEINNLIQQSINSLKASSQKDKESLDIQKQQKNLLGKIQKSSEKTAQEIEKNNKMLANLSGGLSSYVGRGELILNGIIFNA